MADPVFDPTQPHTVVPQFDPSQPYSAGSQPQPGGGLVPDPIETAVKPALEFGGALPQGPLGMAEGGYQWGEHFGLLPRPPEAIAGPLRRYRDWSESTWPGVAGQTVGGMFTKPPTTPTPFWLYYFHIDDIDAAMKRVMVSGGQILEGAVEVPGGSWIARCTDPQGAVFALEGKRSRHTIGYFERVTPEGASNARGCRWSW